MKQIDSFACTNNSFCNSGVGLSGWSMRLSPRTRSARNWDGNAGCCRKRNATLVRVKIRRARKFRIRCRTFQCSPHGAEMLRLALVYATEKGLGICAPLHDAIFVVARADQETWATETLRHCMERAATDIIGVKIPIEMFVVPTPIDSFRTINQWR